MMREVDEEGGLIDQYETDLGVVTATMVKNPHYKGPSTTMTEKTAHRYANLLPALAAAIAAMPDPKKNAKNDHFKNRYADLGAVLECIDTPLRENGLLLTQTIERGDGDAGVLVTTLWHIASGEAIDSQIPLVLAKRDPQAQGGAITYARRYAIKALFGMVDVDDDGNAASNVPSKPAAARSAAKPAKAAPSGIEPYERFEEAMGAVEHAKDLAELDAVRLRIGASNFTGDERQEIINLGRKIRANLGG